MSVACKCDEGVSSLFVSGCEGLVDITSRLIFFPKLDSIGNRNFLDVSTSPIPATVINGAFKNPLPKKRFAITPIGMNPTLVRNENNMQTFDGGQVDKLSNGTTVITLMVKNVSPQEAANYERLECGKNDIMVVTESGQLIGYASLADVKDGKMYGLPVQNISVISQAFKTNTSVSNVVITITLEKSFDLSKVVTIEPSDIEVDMNSVLEPKSVVLSAVTPATNTTAVFKVTSSFYGINGAYPIQGLTATDFSFVKLPSTVITPTSVTETGDGEYTAVYAALTALDVLRIDINPATTAPIVSSGALDQTI